MSFPQPIDDLLAADTQLVFADGAKVYEGLAKIYKKHQTGYFIMAPSGAGKTYFVNHQTQPNWLDGDYLWTLTKAHPAGAWWLDGAEAIAAIDARCDVVTQQARTLGFRIVGASNNWLKPDAIVLPPWETHKAWIAEREANNYDGGATSDRLDQVLSHREWIALWEKQGVPKFESVQEATQYLESGGA